MVLVLAVVLGTLAIVVRGAALLVTVMAPARGLPGIALGNAVGSIIADTGLILGLAAIIGVVPTEKGVVNR